MKTLTSITLSLLCCFALLAQSRSGKENNEVKQVKQMAVISDVHIMAPELLKKDGKAFQTYLANDRKLLQQGTELLDSVCNRLIAANTEVLLITGDLTKDGEKVSHEYLVEHYLKRLKEKGIRVFVIPGNHDVNNPNARIFDGENTPRTETVSASEFANIYKDYGYGDAIARDRNSLSYVTQLDSKTRLIAIDACKYEENNYDKDICVTGGRIKPETMNFIREQVADAKAKGYRVIAMMHHGIVKHWDGQERIMKDYLIDNWEHDAKTLSEMGIKVVFTGHFHSQDVATMKGGLTDVETGSTVSYPIPYRLIGLDTKRGIMNIKTEHISCLGSLSGNSESLEQMSIRFASSSMRGFVNRFISDNVPGDIREKSGKLITEAYIMNLYGDERPSKKFKNEMKNTCGELAKYSKRDAFILSNVCKGFSSDNDRDNDLKLNY
ncbi:MAG TPA: metallophosphoesterase [Xylanibacter oryzae]|nr:metallophosphoesterase [Xylanibacter oryzae]